MPNYGQFIALFKEFISLEEAYVNLWLDVCISQVDEKAFGRQYAIAVYYLTAHRLSVHKNLGDNGGIDRGLITSESIGDLSVSYGQPNTSGGEGDVNYNQTAYGREFLAIRKMQIINYIAAGRR